MAVDLWKRLSENNCSDSNTSFLLWCITTTLFHMWDGRGDIGTYTIFFFFYKWTLPLRKPRSPSLASCGYSSKQKQLSLDLI